MKYIIVKDLDSDGYLPFAVLIPFAGDPCDIRRVEWFATEPEARKFAESL